MTTKKTRKSKRKVTDEPLNIEEGPRICPAPGCKIQVLDPSSEFCVLHTLIADGQKKLKSGAPRGDQALGALFKAGAVVLDVITPFVTQAVNKLAEDPQTTVRRAADVWTQRRSAPSAPSLKKDPFALLGLDAGSATVEDVRKMQKQLAKIYHPDQGTNAAAETKLKEINEAAAECLACLRAVH